jgi:ATP-dependent Lon protease
MPEEQKPEPELISSGQAQPLARADEVLPDELLLLPLSDRPFFPAQVMPVITNEDAWLETMERVGNTPHQLTGLVLTRSSDKEIPAPEDFHEVGCVVRVHQPGRGKGKIQFLAEGLRRFKIERWITRKPPYVVQVIYHEPPVEDRSELRAYALAIINKIKELLPLNPLYQEQLKAFLPRFSPDQPSPLADFAAVLTSAGGAELQEILETVPVLRRLEKVLLLIQKELEVARLQTRIRERVEEKMTEQQRQFFLKEQLKEIQKELGISKDDKTVELEEFKERIRSLTLPEAARARIDDEMRKLSFLEPGSPEYGVTRNYLDVLTSLPWGVFSADHLDLKRARNVLDQDHEGLDDVKDRIIEFLAVGALKGEVSGSILLLVGPPGVGKSSIGRSIAQTLGREFYRFSVGGMRDEAEIKGHRRTYIGAMPGKFIQALRETATSNPVIMLDEIDKIGASYHGDPASALLEVLDPEQNSDFLDHYLDVRFDLSRVLFICTANQLDTIPGALLDRMEIIRLAGYITAEKIAIAKHHLWPKLLERAAITNKQLKISEPGIRAVIEGYAREAGVRNLEKQLGRIVRKVAVKLVKKPASELRIGRREVEDYLGPPVFKRERPRSSIGVVTGLAWTALGGATLSVEASRIHSKQRGLKLTGQLGDVMRESAEIAYSYISSQAERFGAKAGFFDDCFIHLHVPEGATPKDGPSAGITMATALLSLALRHKPLRLAMTGELTLTGQVLAVGGIREKITAAQRNGIKEVILPQANHRDYQELPDHIRSGMTAYFVERFSEVAAIAFG